MKGSPGNHGYPSVRLSRRNKATAHLIHRLVFEAFVGRIPEGLTINHIDGVKTNNLVANLELATYRENNVHAHRMGLNAAPVPKRGGDNPGAKLTNEQADAIRAALARDASYGAGRRLARQYGVSEFVISLIKRNRTYRVEKRNGR